MEIRGYVGLIFLDEASGEALLARDAYGIKALYYGHGGVTLAFSSEVRVLQREGDGVDAGSLRDFFLWGSVPESSTLNAAV